MLGVRSAHDWEWRRDGSTSTSFPAVGADRGRRRRCSHGSEGRTEARPDPSLSSRRRLGDLERPAPQDRRSGRTSSDSRDRARLGRARRVEPAAPFGWAANRRRAAVRGGCGSRLRRRMVGWRFAEDPNRRAPTYRRPIHIAFAVARAPVWVVGARDRAGPGITPRCSRR